MNKAALSGVLQHIQCCWRPTADLLALFGCSPRSAGSAPGSKTNNSSGRIDVLTGVRALALLWVLSFHLIFLGPASDLELAPDKSMPVAPSLTAGWINSWFTQPILNGDLGVDVFFTLSGMLITTMWLRETTKKQGGFNYVRFIVRRYLRLAPMLVVGILVQLLAGYITGHLQDKLQACSEDWWKILLMVNNYTTTEYKCLAQSWTVAVEFQLYLVAPLVLLAAWDPKKGQPRTLWWLTLAGVWAIQPVLRVVIAAVTHGWDPSNWWLVFIRWGVHNLPLTYTAMFTRGAPFVAGMAAALAVQHTKQQRKLQEEQDSPKPVQELQLETVKVEQPWGVESGAVLDGDLHSVKDTTSGVAGSPTIVQNSQQIWKSSYGSCYGSPSSVLSLTDARCTVLDPEPVSRNSSKVGLTVSPCSNAKTWQCPVWVLSCIDLLAVAVCVTFALLGGSQSRHTASLDAKLDIFVVVAGRAIFGAGVAWVLAAALLGRLRIISAVLSWRLWMPMAGLSYGAYLLQDLPLAIVYSWTAVGATTLFAGWAVYWFEFVYFSGLSLAAALPFNLLVEMPFQRIVKRGY